jgi:hypothetical protein
MHAKKVNVGLKRKKKARKILDILYMYHETKLFGAPCLLNFQDENTFT